MDKIEYRSVIRFLTLEGNTPINIYRRMVKLYGNSCPSYSTIKLWAAEVKRGRNHIKDSQRSGRPKTVTSETINSIYSQITSDRRISVRVIAECLNISHMYVLNSIHDELGMKKYCSCWVPKELRTHEKLNRVQAATEFLIKFKHNWGDIKNRLVTGDETWVHRCQFDTRESGRKWRIQKDQRSLNFHQYREKFL
jgi:transposase